MVPIIDPNLRGKALKEALEARRRAILDLPLARESDELVLQFKTDIVDHYIHLIEYIEQLEQLTDRTWNELNNLYEGICETKE